MDPVSLILMQGVSAGMNALGAFYDAKTQQYGLRSAAVRSELQAGISAINARQAEQDANAILAAGRRKQGLMGLQQASVAGTERAATAAGNVAGGSGSALEVAASNRLAYAIDTSEVNLATVGAAGAARMEAVNQRSQTLMAYTEAAAYRRAAGKISPRLMALRAGLGGAQRIGSDWFSYYNSGAGK